METKSVTLIAREVLPIEGGSLRKDGTNIKSRDTELEIFVDHISTGELKDGLGKVKPINILRDTAGAQSMILRSSLGEGGETSYIGQDVMIKEILSNQKRMHLQKVTVKTDYVSGEVVVAVTDKFPMPRIDLLLCNDLVLGNPTDNVILANEPTTTSEDTVVSYPACVVTRAQAAKVELDEDNDIQLADTFMSDSD